MPLEVNAPARVLRLEVLNPLETPGYDRWAEEQEGAAVFHSSAWARVLAEMYGHRPLYLVGVEDGRFTGVLPLMEVESWLGRRRGVSLPFTDLCPPLGPGKVVAALRERAVEIGQDRKWGSVEFRSGAVNSALGEGSGSGSGGAVPSVSFWGHQVRTEGGGESLFDEFSPAVRRAIRKAHHCGVTAEIARDVESMREYYRLHCVTRRRHGLPPQPAGFFDLICRHVMNAGHGFVVLGKLAGKAVSGAVFMNFGEEGVYKFGASVPEAQPVRANNLVMWEGFKRCAELGCKRVHLGRTSKGNEGLRRFKQGFGGMESTIDYECYDFRQTRWVQKPDRAKPGWVNHVFRAMPMPCLRWAGRMLYPHLA